MRWVTRSSDGSLVRIGLGRRLSYSMEQEIGEWLENREAEWLAKGDSLCTWGVGKGMLVNLEVCSVFFKECWSFERGCSHRLFGRYNYMKYIMNEESELWYRLQSYLVLITAMLATLGTDTGCGYGLGSTCLSLYRFRRGQGCLCMEHTLVKPWSKPPIQIPSSEERVSLFCGLV